MNGILCILKEDGSDKIEGAFTTIHQNYRTQLCKVNEDETKNINIAAVGARLGGGFDYTSKLKVIKLKKAMKQPELMERRNPKGTHQNGDEQSMGAFGQKKIYQREQSSMHQHGLVRRKAMVPRIKCLGL